MRMRNQFRDAGNLILRIFNQFRCSHELIAGTQKLIQGTRKESLGTHNLFLSTRNQFRGTQNLFPGTQNLFRGTQNLFPGTPNRRLECVEIPRTGLKFSENAGIKLPSRFVNTENGATPANAEDA
jgi:hypothetical protein